MDDQGLSKSLPRRRGPLGREEANMTVQSKARFGVSGESPEDVIPQVETLLLRFNAQSYGVSSIRVEPGPRDTIQIVLIMRSRDLDEADAKADAASEAILRLLQDSPSSEHLHERQRELVLA